jgi:hypothetical protein
VAACGWEEVGRLHAGLVEGVVFAIPDQGHAFLGGLDADLVLERSQRQAQARYEGDSPSGTSRSS